MAPPQRDGWRVWTQETRPPHVCYLAERGRSALNGVDIKGGEENPKWGALGSRPYWTGAWLTTKTSPFPFTCTSNLVVLCQRMYTEIEGNPKLGERWGPASLRWVRGWPPRNTPLPTRVTLPNLVVLGQTAQGLLRRSARKKWPSWPAFQGQSSHRNRHTGGSTTHDFLLTFHSNHGPVSHRFRDKRRFQSNIAIFPPSFIFNAAAGFG